MVEVRILAGLPGDPRPIAFPTDWEAAGRGGTVVEFKTERGRWVGNFKPRTLPGRRGISLVGVHPNKRDAVVVATGDLWVIEPEKKTGERVLSALDGALEVREPEGWVFSRYGLALMRFGPEGLIWHTQRLSLGGFKSVSFAQGEVKGVAEATFEGRPAAFVVDSNTGSSKDGRYGTEEQGEWERQSVQMLSANLASILSMEVGKYLRWAPDDWMSIGWRACFGLSESSPRAAMHSVAWTVKYQSRLFIRTAWPRSGCGRPCRYSRAFRGSETCSGRAVRFRGVRTCLHFQNACRHFLRHIGSACGAERGVENS